MKKPILHEMILQILQFLLLLLTFVIGLLICVPIIKIKSSFNGSCLLYANINRDGDQIEEGKNNVRHFIPSSHASCNFCIFTGILTFLSALVLISGLSVIVYCKLRNNIHTSRRVRLSNYNALSERPSIISAWINFIICVTMTIILFITSCLISSGFNSFCEDTIKKIFVEVKRCRLLEEYIGAFYSNLSLAQVSAWIGSSAWLLLSILARIQLRRFNLDHKRFNKSPAVLNQDYELITRSPIL